MFVLNTEKKGNVEEKTKRKKNLNSQKCFKLQLVLDAPSSIGLVGSGKSRSQLRPDCSFSACECVGWCVCVCARERARFFFCCLSSTSLILVVWLLLLLQLF